MSKYDAYLDHLRTIAECFNSNFADREIPVRVTVNTNEYQYKGNDAVKDYVAGVTEGMLHEPQIQTFADVVQQIRSEPSINIAINGVTQCGKTGTSNSMYFLGPIFYMMVQERYATMMLVINRKGTYNQTKDEFNRFRKLYGDALVFHRLDGSEVPIEDEPESGVTLNGYWTRIIKQLLPPEIEFEDVDDQIQRRTHAKKALQRLKGYLVGAKANKINLVLMADEMHFGTDVHGTQAKIFDYRLDDMKSLSSKNIFIGFSATNYELCNLENVAQIPHHLSDGYVGFNMFAGEIVDPDATVKQPEFVSLSGLGERCDLRNLDLIRSSHYTDPEKYEKTELAAAMSHADYRSFVQERIAAIIQWTLVTDNPKNGKGLMLRFCRSNDDAREFAAILSGLVDPSIAFINYFAEGGQKSVKDTIQGRRNAPTGPYVIIMTAAGRLASAFPRDCTYFVDFTHAAQNYTSLLQGTVGRATGYGKNPLIVLSDKNTEVLRRYVDTLGSPHGYKTGMRVIHVGGRGRPNVRFLIVRAANVDPVIERKFRELEADISDRYLSKITFPTGDIGPGPGGGRSRVFSIFDEETLDYIEGHSKTIVPSVTPGFRLLRPHECVGENNMMYEWRDGEAVVALRKAREDDTPATNINTRGDSNVAVDYQRPQIHYSRLDGRILGITFRCRRGFRQTDTAVLPSTETHVKEFATDEERKIIES